MRSVETPKVTIERIKKYMSENLRFDNRKKEEFREIKIETGFAKNAEGSARVILGKTEVIVGVKLAVGEPYPDSQDKGNLMVTAEMLPLSSPRFELGPPKFDAIELGRIIDRGIRESKFIELEKICIKEGEKVWTVFIDIYSINDDGNLLDAAGIGAVAALKNTKIPFYDVEENKIDYDKESKEMLPLSKNVPFSITIHKIGDNLLVDPTREEEDASEARITIGLVDGAYISSIQKGNSKDFSPSEIESVLDLAEKVYKNTFPKISKQQK